MCKWVVFGYGVGRRDPFKWELLVGCYEKKIHPVFAHSKNSKGHTWSLCSQKNRSGDGNAPWFSQERPYKGKKKKIADANMATLATMHRIFLFMFRCLFHQGNSTDVSWSSSRTQEMKQFRQVIGQDRKKYCYHVNLSSCLFLIAFHASAVVSCF